jgi:transcriptional regulator with XRE-family HTH domain
MKSQFKNAGQYLKNIREKRKQSQAALGQACGNIHAQFVSNWERGLCMPPKHCLSKLAKALKLRNDEKKELKEAILKDVTSMIEEEYEALF